MAPTSKRLRVPFPEGGRIAVASDLQRTSLVERLILQEQNDPEREAVVASIAAERPAVALLLGDHVFLGASVGAWAFFDRIIEPLRRADVELLPILGNHDCWSLGPAGLRHYFSRFPRVERLRYYTTTLGPLGIVALDSNQLFMPSIDWQDQLRFHEEALAAFDEDPEVRGVVVLVHHPPWTNGTVTGPSALVERAFVPAFLRSRKGILMLSGHVHAYEHFTRDDRHFVVCGGGGGPRHRLLAKERRKFSDLFDGAPIRDFHFLMLDPKEGGLDVRAHGIAKGTTHAKPMDAFEIAWRH